MSNLLFVYISVLERITDTCKVTGGGIEPHYLQLQIPITMATKVSPLININHPSFHGCISGPQAIRRLKSAKTDCYLVRYSDNQTKYLLTVLKKGLGEDKDNDLIKEFEILIIKWKKCKINGIKKAFNTLDEMFLYYDTVPIHPSVTSLGEICHSPRHKQREKCDWTESIVSQMSAAETLTCLREQREEFEKRIEDLQQTVEKSQSQCIIL